MAESLHSQLVRAAAAWLSARQRCTVVATEMASACGETPDAIGWKGHVSTLVECKASRQDFRADREKWFRQAVAKGLGQYRYFLAPKGLLKLSDLPPKWGLLEFESGRAFTTYTPHAFDRSERNLEGELLLLLSALRRVGQSAPRGVSVRCYKLETGNTATLGISPGGEAATPGAVEQAADQEKAKLECKTRTESRSEPGPVQS